jgi:hypothetical protein
MRDVATVDQQAKELLALKDELETAKLAVETKEEELLKWLKKEGVIPTGAEKSLRLEGNTYIITASFGISTSIVEDVVDEIQEQLSDDCQPRLFAGLFQKQTSHIVAPTAPTVLENCSKKVRALFARVLSHKPKKASVTVKKKAKGAKAKKAAAR